MSDKFRVECNVCGKKEVFGDAKDISYAKWKIIAWTLPSGDPKVCCPNCDYGKQRKIDR